MMRTFGGQGCLGAKARGDSGVEMGTALGLFSIQSQCQGEVGKHVGKASFLAYSLDRKRGLVNPWEAMVITRYTQQKRHADLSFEAKVVIRQCQRHA